MILSKKSEASIFLEEMLKKLKNVKIKSIFALTSPFWNTHKGYRSYDSDTEVYILFENDMCMIIEYYFIDSLEIELRLMTSEEKEKYSKVKRRVAKDIKKLSGVTIAVAPLSPFLRTFFIAYFIH